MQQPRYNIMKTEPLLLSAIFLIAIAAVIFFVFGERFLAVDDLPVSGNTNAVVVLLASNFPEDRDRIMTGIEVFRDYHARYLILPVRDKGVNWSTLRSLYSIPEGDIHPESIIIGRAERPDRRILKHFGGTYLEAMKTKEIASSCRIESIVVVSSGYHMRRTRLAFARTGLDGEFRIHYHPARDTHPLHGSDRMVKILVEYSKLMAACITYE